MSDQVTSPGLQRLLQILQQEGISDPRVLAAIAAVPRQSFMDASLAHKAYDNTALPIGVGQTISQPYIVAKMTELLLQGGPMNRVLEVGTGSGYQTAVLAQVVPQVCSIERIQTLQYQAKRRLRQLDLHNVSMKFGDGWQGWETKAPFDGILVTAAPDDVPTALLEQLADGGRMIIPVGGNEQVLQRITRQGDKFYSEQIESVRFVPLVKGIPG
ncbi:MULTISPECIES: protein-L-isoaspartate(D-aspartate) O-methyltransferase [Corallincola]|uniref:Protein-L-isoaspartate O-methyltransferase n=2 Tax=Corallincola TaxID=1775176 RepID=A0ABY1WRL3_9GAMM|nr:MULTISPECIES: protein-L-isoaspartate(D-aspartate) O-methyltransferase [Corallincola]TAA47365.1 protein-L-isoaspartate(D-aspartate) O-methyltransferase [Corallincola spongiicola]TCI05026.1 protein-L-isoaspartate(D-aspartate) O-methyltransferase [Corallincola luteus]